MNVKKTVTIVLLLFVVAAAGMMIVRGINNAAVNTTAEISEESAQNPQEAGAAETVSSNPDADVDVVYYFMTTQRCPTCMKIEAFTKTAVEDNFSKELQSSKLAWKIVNVDEPSNRHFIEDYELYTKSVVLVRYRDGKQVKWKNLDEVWNHVNNEDAFKQYIADEVKAFLREV